MSTPRVTEIPARRAVVEHDDFADEPVRSPRRPPYDRAAMRRMIQRSLLETHLDVYPNRTRS